MPDLADRLAEAARRAVLNQRPSLRHDPGSLKSVTVELALDRTGLIRDAECYLGRRVSVDRIVNARG